MSARAWAAAAIIGTSIVGCTAMSTDGRGGGHFRSGVKDCESSAVNCELDVDVFCASNEELHCVILVSDAVVKLRPKDGGDQGTRHVAWKLSDSAFEFPSDAITFDQSGFTCPVNTDKRWQCRYDKSAPRKAEQYKYTIKVKPKSGTRVVDPLDPWVVTN